MPGTGHKVIIRISLFVSGGMVASSSYILTIKWMRQCGAVISDQFSPKSQRHTIARTGFFSLLLGSGLPKPANHPVYILPIPTFIPPFPSPPSNTSADTANLRLPSFYCISLNLWSSNCDQCSNLGLHPRWTNENQSWNCDVANFVVTGGTVGCYYDNLPGR